MADEFVCAISGAAAKAAEPDDDGDDLPVGWARVTISIRSDNPRWAMIDVAEKAVLRMQLEQLPEDKRAEATPLFQVIAETNVAALRSRTPRYLDEEHEVFVSDDELGELLDTLGIKADA